MLDGAETPPLPLEPCDPRECSDDHCDATASVSAVSVETAGGKLRLVHVHLMAPGKSASGIFWGAPCRSRQLAQVFEGLAGSGAAALVTSDATIVAGDFNLDPVRLIGDPESAIWQRHVGAGRRFSDMTPRARNGSQYGTRRGGLGIALDHVLADRARGVCIVHGHGIGVDPGTEPLDAGFDWSELPGGSGYASRIDHFAITCELTLDLGAQNEQRDALSARPPSSAGS